MPTPKRDMKDAWEEETKKKKEKDSNEGGTI